MKPTVLMAALVAFGMSSGPGVAGDVEAGAERYNKNCVNCHGRSGQGMASFPAIKGHEAAYISGRLETYRAKEMVGPNSAIMMSLVEDMSDAEIANLAAYISATFP